MGGKVGLLLIKKIKKSLDRTFKPSFRIENAPGIRQFGESKLV